MGEGGWVERCDSEATTPLQKTKCKDAVLKKSQRVHRERRSEEGDKTLL